jgi:hypothetical protein
VPSKEANESQKHVRTVETRELCCSASQIMELTLYLSEHITDLYSIGSDDVLKWGGGESTRFANEFILVTAVLLSSS